MSTLGLIVFLLFLCFMGGSVLLYYADSRKVVLARLLVLGLYLIVTLELILAIFEWPAKVIDGILFICMGMETIANVMLIIVAAVLAFVLLMILPKIKWKKFLRTTPAKLIVCGTLVVLLLTYTELFNGIYSFERSDDFYDIKEAYSEYDAHFLPTKFIELEKDKNDQDEARRIAVYPFDATTADGKQPFAYKVKLYQGVNDAGEPTIFYYPFTYKTYVASLALDINVKSEMVDLMPEDNTSQSDISASDLSDSDVSGGDLAE